MIVLHTKLYRPGVTKGLIVRPRLFAKLDAGLEGPLTLVVAPAGFGKTTLVSSWLQTLDGDHDTPLPSAWLTLDEGDKDRDVFLQYFIAALQTIFPEAGAETLNMLNARQQAPTRVLLNSLSNEIDALPGRFVMVMDDLHTSHGQALFDTLNQWLQHWPRRLHLVFLSRFNPPLSLPTLRARGLVTEIQSRDLRFTPAEAVEYFDRALGSSIDESRIVLLHERLEGWIAGLKMASLFFGEHKSANDLTAGLLDNDAFIIDYLIEEVIAGQPPKIQRFLLKTSILDQFSASLTESLMDDEDAECNVHECIDYVRAADLFLIRLDNQQEWYRFHHLFRDALRQRLPAMMPAPRIKEMHVRVAEWFCAHGLPEQAIHHAMETGDLELAVSYMEQGLCDVLNREDRSILERWLRMVPEEFIAQSPGLLIMRAFLHAFRWEIGPMTEATRQAEALMDKSDSSERAQIFLGLIGALEGSSYYDVNQYDQVITYSRQALSSLPPQWQYPRGIAASYVGMGIHASGRPEAAQQFLSGQYESYRDKGDSYALRLLLAVAINHIQSGNYENAERTAHMILRQADQGRLPIMKGWWYYLLGLLNYEWNELDKAAESFGQVVDLFYTTQLAAARNGMIGQAWTFQALGRSAEALQAINRLSEVDLEISGYEQIDTTSARARLLLMNGGGEAAERWIDMDTSRLSDKSLLIWMGHPPVLTRARILLARNKGADSKTALQLLDTVGQLAERTFNTRITIEVRALRSLALLNLGDGAGAQDALVRSVELARNGRFTRTFVDMGPQMQTLLSRIAGHATVSKTVGRILAAFPQAEQAGPALPYPQAPAATRDGNYNDGELDERLTQRELEILLLMAEPVSFRDIASRMDISYTTARRYTINVYSKLDVHSRWEAVDSAIRKGIIAPR